MAKLAWGEIESRANEFVSKWHDSDSITSERGEAQSFWSDFLSMYGVDRRRHGAFFEYAIKKGSGSQGFIDMFWPGKLLVEQKAPGRDLTKATVQAYDYLTTMPDHDLPEAIVLSNFSEFIFIKLDTREEIHFTLDELPRYVKLFGFIFGESSRYLAENNPVNRKAAESMAKLHNQLRDNNYTGHDLEVLLVRLVFILFADDSGIFELGQIYRYITEHTSEDGSDLGGRLIQIFEILNRPVEERQASLDESLMSLAYVNGGLFEESIRTPHFTGDMRRALIETMELDWSKVSPAIFGSMFQGAMDDVERRNLGAHYTSEINILRVIKPLFLDDLYEEFTKATQAGPRKKFDELRKLQDKIAGLTFLDPACGSGNFLVITYRELRKLEHKIVEILSKDNQTADMFASAGAGVGTLKANVDQMYGIEIEEFPSLIAQAALWLTDHQMNMEFSAQSGRTFKRLPLTHSATIVNDNALTKDWAEVIAPEDLDYILGNPPFLGQTYQSKEQKQEVAQVLSGIKKTGVLDFVSAWYGKAADIMSQNKKIQTALVSTNSITQGEQANIIWNYLFNKGVKINFAHRTFKWTNDARGIAAVHCVIVGFALFERKRKTIFEYQDIRDEPIEAGARNINQYLVDGASVIVNNRNKPIADVPKMSWGNKATDGGYLLLDKKEKERTLKTEPAIEKYIRPFVGGRELLNGGDRYCLWLVGANPSDIRTSEFISNRLQKVRDFRLASSAVSTRAYADRPAIFRQIAQPDTDYLAIPEVSSERRNYIPMAYLNKDIICSNKIQFIPNATSYHLGVLSSLMHMAWMRTVAGRLKSDYLYSNTIVYNNFIWPEATDAQKADIEKLAQAVLDARTEFPDSSLADLYDPLTMPPSLAKAHKSLDRAVDRLYQKEPFATDADRVALLFEKYQRVVK